MIHKRFIRSVQRWNRRFREKYFSTFIFIHINRTAGVSIQTALGQRLASHKTALEKRAALGQARWERRFSFTFVRNPWDRAVSQYHRRLLKNRIGPPGNPVGFNQWVELAYGEKAPEYNNGSRLFLPQWNWITDQDGTVLVDFIGRFENLQQDFNTVCLQIGKRVILPHRNKSKRSDYRTYYHDASIEIIGQWFKDDIEPFGYAFDDPSNAIVP